MKCCSQYYRKIGTTLRALERFIWPDKGWVSYPEKNEIDIRRVGFSNEFTPEILWEVSVMKHEIMKKKKN